MRRVHTSALHEIANIVGTVMGYAERGNLKLAQCESYVLLYHTSMVRFYLLSNTIVALDALMYFYGSYIPVDDSQYSDSPPTLHGRRGHG